MDRDAPQTMQRVAFTMKLHQGCEEEYRRRHQSIWPELKDVLKGVGIMDYSIFLDAGTNTLFGYLKIPDHNSLTLLRENPVMQKWWRFMKEVMDTHEDASPVTINLQEVFYLE